MLSISHINEWAFRTTIVNLPEEVEVFDVMTEFAPILGQWNPYYQDYTWKKLSTCASYYNYRVSEEEYHNSLFDVRAILYCFEKMIGEDRDEN